MPYNPDLWRQAWDRLPLPKLMEALGDGAHVGKTKSCPFCGSGTRKKTFGTFTKGNRHLFKCWSSDCVANNVAAGHDEIGYLCLRKGLSREDASEEYIKLALPEITLTEFITQKSDYEPPPPKELPEAATAKTRNVWHALWKRLTLTAEDRKLLHEKRGFSDATIDELGFRSNNKANLPALEDLATSKEFTRDQLTSAGIFQTKHGFKPNFQLYGWGPTGEKNADGKPIFAETNQLLIPYHDLDGIPDHIRPHKGGIAKPDEDDILEEVDENEETCSSHVYSPYTLGTLIAENEGLCVLTEGEFKVAALYQCGIAAIAAPGISFIANKAFLAELIDLLDEFNVTDLVIIYDNEVKDDPQYKDKYKEDPWKRYDSIVWAEYAMLELRDRFVRIDGTICVGQLPDECRNGTGKADFDSILGRLVYDKGVEKGTREATKIFRGVIAKAQKSRETGERPLDLFPSHARRIIESKLRRLRHRPLLSIGGDRENKLAARFFEVDPDTKPRRAIDGELAAMFKACIGCYYERKKPNDKQRPELVKQLTALDEAISRAKDEKKLDFLHYLNAKKASVKERLKGLPEPVSTFTLECLYKLHISDGSIHRMVKMHSKLQRNNNSSVRRLVAADISHITSFKEWSFATGDGSWMGGSKPLDRLLIDMDHESFLRDIYEILHFGYHPESKIWFAGDVGFADDGAEIHPDNSGIYWHNGVGYTIDQTTDEKGANPFSQGAPKFLSPHDVPIMEEEELRGLLNIGDEDPCSIEAALFRTFSEDMYDSIGGYDAFLAIGISIAYAAAPELLKKGGHPGAWFVGRMSGGKTSAIRFLLRIWGFKHLNELARVSGTANGIARVLAQYSCLPVGLDEFRAASVTKEKEDILRGAFDRSSAPKAVADYSTRTRQNPINTTPIVSGESSSSDAGTRSRYAHVLFAAVRRIGDARTRYIRMTEYAPHLYRIGCWLLRNRPAFLKEFFKYFDAFSQDKSVRELVPNPRLREVHGVAFSAFQALSNLLSVPSFSPSKESAGAPESQRTQRTLNGFYSWILAHADQALHDVQEETFINQFWSDVIQGIFRLKIKRRFFSIRWVSVRENGSLKIHEKATWREDESLEIEGNVYPLGDPDRPIRVCYVAFKEVFADYEEDRRSRGNETPLSLNDLRREMEKEPYWTPPPKDTTRVHRIKLDGVMASCWVINIDRAPPAEEGGEPGPFFFPHAEDLFNTILQEKPKE